MNVVDYISSQPSPQKEILQKLRKIILKANRGIFEEMKMGAMWYEGKFYLAGMKDHVNMGFAYNKMLERYKKKLEGKGQYMHHRKFRTLADIDEKMLTELMKVVKEGYKDPHTKLQ